jgi:hypothetical protein
MIQNKDSGRFKFFNCSRDLWVNRSIQRGSRLQWHGLELRYDLNIHVFKSLNSFQVKFCMIKINNMKDHNH